MTEVSQLLGHVDSRRVDTTEILEAYVIRPFGQTYELREPGCADTFFADGDPRLSLKPGEAVQVGRSRGGTGSSPFRFQILTNARRPTGAGGVLERLFRASILSRPPRVVYAVPNILDPEFVHLLTLLAGVYFLDPTGELGTLFTAVRETAPDSGEFEDHPEVTISDVTAPVSLENGLFQVTCTVTTTANVTEGEEIGVRAVRAPPVAPP